MQGVGGALSAFPAVWRLSVLHFRRREEGRRFEPGWLFAITTAIGPVLGGWLVDKCFLAGGVLPQPTHCRCGGIDFVLHVPESRDAESTGRIDMKGPSWQRSDWAGWFTG